VPTHEQQRLREQQVQNAVRFVDDSLPRVLADPVIASPSFELLAVQLSELTRREQDPVSVLDDLSAWFQEGDPTVLDAISHRHGDPAQWITRWIDRRYRR
jgi:hypothetical protein